jgi:hypothetical protein
MNRLCVVAAAALLGFAGVSAAQGTGEGTRGTTPPGRSTDGSRPSDGAINGGTILPGERSGVPGSGGTKSPSVDGDRRCNDLSGSLREQCLLQERGSSTGGTRDSAPGADRPAEPSTAPPPQKTR